METRYLYVLRFSLVITDILLLNLCFFLGYTLFNHSGIIVNTTFYWQSSITSCLLWFLSAGVFSLYTDTTLRNVKLLYGGTWRSIVLHGFFFQAYMSFSAHPGFSKFFILSFYGCVLAAFFAARFMGTQLRELLAKNFDIRKVVAVLGRNQGGIKLAAYLKKQSNLNFVGFLGKTPQNISDKEFKTMLSDQLKAAANSNVEEVFITIDPRKMDDLDELIAEGEKQCVRLKFVPDLTASHSKLQPGRMGDFTVLSARKEPLEKIANRVKKRLADFIFSTLVIVFLLSWLVPLIAVIIKLQSTGPVFFKQLRSGRNNKSFYCYKFRSMKADRGNEERQARKNDTRLTPFGKFMRKTSLDELPQFINVWLGEMSVIGPRPHMVAHTEEYRKIIDTYMIRQFLKPGISGWAQVNGYRGETRHTGLMEKRVEYDIWYMERWSTALDLKIIFLTVLNIFKKEDGAY